jgi:NADH:ubiquinone oxidoreductase subunit 6 (subunit J)
VCDGGKKTKGWQQHCRCGVPILLQWQQLLVLVVVVLVLCVMMVVRASVMLLGGSKDK